MSETMLPSSEHTAGRAFVGLLWKEWVEQGSGMLLGVFIVGGFALIGLTSRLILDEGVLILSVFMGGVVFPLLVATGLIAPEREDRTLAMLLRLPIDPSLVLAAKTLVAAVIVAVPLLAGMIVFLLIAAGREVTAIDIAARYIGGVFMSWIVLLWTLCPTVGLRSEALVGLAGAAILVAFFMAMSIFGSNVATLRWTPYAMMHPRLDWSRMATLLWPQLCMGAGLWAWAWWRLSRLGRAEG